ncbi:MAG TPA: FtsX-like permease family protein [Roseiflexaceae bacterium]|nr:FtsX-like permease family protein [Roseiflexaceae bacterium]
MGSTDHNPATDAPAGASRGRRGNSFPDPLALSHYYRRNGRRVVPILLILVLSFFGIALPAVIVNSLRDAPRQILRIYEHMALVWPNTLYGYQVLDAGQLRLLPGASAVYPVTIEETFWPTLVGEAQGGMPVFGLRQADQATLMPLLGVRLAAGRLPQPYTPELAIHTAVAQSRRLALGDTIDPDQDSEDLEERFVIVGLLDGPVPLVLLNREYLLAVSPVHGHGQRDEAWMVVAQPEPDGTGGYPTLERALRALPADRFVVRSYGNQLELVEDINSSLDMVLVVLTLVIVSVLTLAIALLHYVYVMRRMSEFGILLALGAGRSRLIRRALLETVVLIGIAWVIGLALAELACGGLQLLLAGRGVALTTLEPRVLLLSVPLALGSGLSCLLTLLWQLTRLDPVSIIEHRD